MASEYRRRTLLTWGVFGAAGYGLERATRSADEDARLTAEERGRPWHRHPIEALASSPDGALIATGSRPGGDSLMDESEGVVRWAVDEARPNLKVPIPGGLRSVEPAFAGLTFSPDGLELAALTRRNVVDVIDVAPGMVDGHHALSAIEQSPRFFFSQNSRQIFVANTTLPGTIGQIAEARAVTSGRPVPFDDSDAEPFRLDERGLHVVSGAEYRIIPPQGPPTTMTTLLPGQRLSVAVDVARRHLAVVVPGKIATVDLETGEVKTGEHCDATRVVMQPGGVPLGFAYGDTSWQAYRYGEGLEQETLFGSSMVEGVMAGAVPAALSPNGLEALVLQGNSEVVAWSLVGRPKTILGSLGEFQGARGVAWLRERVAVVFGPSLLAFCDPRTRRVIKRYEFPRW